MLAGVPHLGVARVAPEIDAFAVLARHDEVARVGDVDRLNRTDILVGTEHAWQEKKEREKKRESETNRNGGHMNIRNASCSPFAPLTGQPNLTVEVAHTAFLHSGALARAEPEEGGDERERAGWKANGEK